MVNSRFCKSYRKKITKIETTHDYFQPHLTSWSTKQPIAWLLSSIRILSKANSFNGDYVISSLNSHTPMHSPRINTNFVFYVRNSKVALWRRETRSGIYIEPHQIITRSHHTSWLCKSEIELTVNEEIFATGIAKLDENGHLDGTVCVGLGHFPSSY